MTTVSPSTDDSPGLPATTPSPSARWPIRPPCEPSSSGSLTSPTFAASERLSRFLRFAVEQVLEGKGDRLKEYVLGVEVFDRDERDDPRLDSIVRVEARRLRGEAGGVLRIGRRADTLVFRLPKGSYVPQVVERPDPPAVADGAIVPPSAHRRRWLAAAVVLAVAAASGVLAVRWGGAIRRAPGEMAIALAVLPSSITRGSAAPRRSADRRPHRRAHTHLPVLPFALARASCGSRVFGGRCGTWPGSSMPRS